LGFIIKEQEEEKKENEASKRRVQRYLEVIFYTTRMGFYRFVSERKEEKKKKERMKIRKSIIGNSDAIKDIKVIRRIETKAEYFY
jgi:predicted nuclease of restriction endonuclease-like (RecB) superfamily